MTDEDRTLDHEEIDLLLPWYVNKSLDAVERERVARHVSDCEDCRQNVFLLAKIQSAVLTSAATPIVPKPRLDKLIDTISSRQSVSYKPRESWRSLIAAVAITIVLISGLILTGPGNAPGLPREYETATANQATHAMDYVLSIQFSAETSQSEHNRVLQNIGARDVSGGNAEGSYRVIVQLSAMTLEELDRFTENLQSLPEVKSVQVVALQLPLKAKQ